MAPAPGPSIQPLAGLASMRQPSRPCAPFTLIALTAAAVLLGGCRAGLLPEADTRAEIESVKGSTTGDEASPAAASEVSRARLQAEVTRFAVGYGTNLLPLIDEIKRGTDDPALRLQFQQLKRDLNVSWTFIILGKSPDLNLLDSLVFATLLRAVVEEHWSKQGLSAEMNTRLLDITRKAETEIWDIASNVMSEAQMQTLRAGIELWKREHPEVTRVSSVRFVEFAAELGEENIAALGQPGGILPEVSEATRAVDAVRDTAERGILLGFSAPTLARAEMELLSYELALQPEIRDLITTLRSFGETSDSLRPHIEQLPALVAAEREAAISQAMLAISEERDAAIRQMLAGVAHERAVIFDELADREEGVLALLVELKATLEVGRDLAGHIRSTVDTIDQLATRLELDKPDREKTAFKIQEYRDAFIQATETTRELNSLLASLDAFLEIRIEQQGNASVRSVVENLDTGVRDWVKLAFGLALLFAVIVIVLTGAVLFLFYRRAVAPR